MPADQEDMINHLMAQLATTPQGPNLYGLQAAVDPNSIQALIGKMKQQQVLDNANAPTPGPYGYLHDAGKAAFNSIGSNLGGQLAALGNGPQQQSPLVAAQQQAIAQGNQQNAADLASGTDPLQARINALQKAVQANIPGASQALDAAVDAQNKNRTTASQGAKDDAQAKAALDEIQNRADQLKMKQAELDKSTQKDTWTTINESPSTVVQKNGLGEVRVQQKQNASQAAAANVSPDAMQAMLDSYHTTGTPPPGMARSPAMAGAFWDAEAKYQASTGNTAGSVLAAKASAKANTDALAQTQKQISSTTSYFDTMDKNIANVNGLASKLNLSDQPTMNKAIAAFQQGTSDPDFAKYNVFFDSVANEYAKIKSGSLGNAPVSDSARKEAQSVLLPLMSAGGVQAALEAVKTEGQNRLDALNAQRDSLVLRLQGKTPPPAATAAQPSASAPAASPALTYDTKTGTFH